MSCPVFLIVPSQKTCFSYGHSDYEIKDCKQRMLRYCFRNQQVHSNSFKPPIKHSASFGLSYAQAVIGNNFSAKPIPSSPSKGTLVPPRSSASARTLEPLQSLVIDLTNEVKSLKAEISALKESTPAAWSCQIEYDDIRSYLTSFYDSTSTVSQEYVLDNFDVLVSSMVILSKEIAALKGDFKAFKDFPPFF